MEDAQFDGASINSIRSHLESWVEHRGMQDQLPSYRMFIVIDEESFQALLDAPPVEELIPLRRGASHWVKLVETWPDLDPIFEGWMKCSLRALWNLWPVTQDGDCMRMSHMMVRGVRDVWYGRCFEPLLECK